MVDGDGSSLSDVASLLRSVDVDVDDVNDVDDVDDVSDVASSILCIV